MMKIKHLTYVICLLLCSCSASSDRDQLRRDIEALQGQVLRLPDIMTDALSGDTIDLKNVDFTILTYVDSAGCTECKMKLPLWKVFIESVDSISYRDVAFVTVVETDDVKNLKRVLRRNAFGYSVFVDTAGMIYRQNQFPDQFMLQTFLLDKNRRVIAIGNPVFNSDVAALYSSLISGEKSSQIAGDAPVRIDNPMFDFGESSTNEVLNHIFSLTNIETDTLYIRDIVSTCECIEAVTSADTLPPDSSLRITVKVSPESSEQEFFRSIDIFFKNYDYPVTLSIRGNII